MLRTPEIPHYTYEDYLHWEGRWELIGGHPIAMSPAPVPRHQRITAELLVLFIASSRKAKCRHCKVYDPIDYKISDDTIIQPNVLIVCHEIKEKFLDFPPALVVEVLSDSTAMRDRNTKFEIYQQQGVKYYLIVDADANKIEIYSFVNGAYQIQEMNANEFDFLINDDCAVKVDFNEINWD